MVVLSTHARSKPHIGASVLARMAVYSVSQTFSDKTTFENRKSGLKQQVLIDATGLKSGGTEEDQGIKE